MVKPLRLFHFKQAMRPSELAPDARFGYWYRTL